MSPFKTKGRIYHNLSTQDLYEFALQKKNAVKTKQGALLFTTGKYTGRNPKAKYIVKEPSSQDRIAWGEVNRPFDPEAFHRLHEKVTRYLGQRDVFIQDSYEGADLRYRLPIRVVSENPAAALFSKSLFLPCENPEKFQPYFTLLHAPNLCADPAADQTATEAFVIIHLAEKIILIGGTHYAGEIKKAVFTVMNYLMPDRNVLPMHCSANYGKDEDDAAIFFGLSGTGKTTLSAAPGRTLVGDDEHGWSDHGIFNFEGGCYAKVIRLSKEGEPEIYSATQRFGTLLENVVMNPQTGEIDLNDDSITENTRAAYPITHMPHMTVKGVSGHPQNILMLTCDAFSIFPPVAKLNQEQAMYHFLSGYTAKVAGTESGVKEPEATFSPCFGGPFMPRFPKVYADLLGQRADHHHADVWLINTGWSGGPYGEGKRIPLEITRAIVNAILSGSLKKARTLPDPILGIEVPVSCPNVPQALLHPKETWKNPQAYDKKARELTAMFHHNIKKLALNKDPLILKGGPNLQRPDRLEIRES